MADGEAIPLRLSSLATAIRAMLASDAQSMDDYAIANAGGIPPAIRLAIGPEGEAALLRDGYGGHCLDAILDPQGEDRSLLHCLEHELPVIRYLHGAWRDRRITQAMPRTVHIQDHLCRLTETRLALEAMGRACPAKIEDALPVLVDAAMRDMNLAGDAAIEDPARVWTSPVQYALVLHRAPDRNGSMLLCRGDDGTEFTYRQPTEEVSWKRMPVGSRILVYWRGRTVNHPGYRHRMLCPDSVKVQVRRGDAPARRHAFVDVPVTARVVMNRDTRDAPKGATGTVEGYGDGTCRIVLDDGLREVSARAECIVRKRRPRGGNRRIETHSIL